MLSWTVQYFHAQGSQGLINPDMACQVMRSPAGGSYSREELLH